MGVNASVLQWHCENCSQINPIERQRCVSCQTSRAVTPHDKVTAVNLGTVHSKFADSSQSENEGDLLSQSDEEADDVDSPNR